MPYTSTINVWTQRRQPDISIWLPYNFALDATWLDAISLFFACSIVSYRIVFGHLLEDMLRLRIRWFPFGVLFGAIGNLFYGFSLCRFCHCELNISMARLGCLCFTGNNVFRVLRMMAVRRMRVWNLFL